MLLKIVIDANEWVKQGSTTGSSSNSCLRMNIQWSKISTAGVYIVVKIGRMQQEL